MALDFEPIKQLTHGRGVAGLFVIASRIGAVVDQPAQPLGFRPGRASRPVANGPDRHAALLAATLDAVIEDESPFAGSRHSDSKPGNQIVPGDRVASRGRRQRARQGISEANRRRNLDGASADQPRQCGFSGLGRLR